MPAIAVENIQVPWLQCMPSSKVDLQAHDPSLLVDISALDLLTGITAMGFSLLICVSLPDHSLTSKPAHDGLIMFQPSCA